jgi:hypothetical protein
MSTSGVITFGVDPAKGPDVSMIAVGDRHRLLAFAELVTDKTAMPLHAWQREVLKAIERGERVVLPKRVRLGPSRWPL